MKLVVNPGDRFGQLIIIREANKIRGKRAFEVKCDCGAIAVKWLIQLTTGKTQSCGCWKRERLGTWAKTHGMCKTPTYRVWMSMRKRCENMNEKSYVDYGGRGIKVCERWLRFENFLADMGMRPTAKHEISRIDNDGNYEPGNCEWSTDARQQNINRRPMGTSKFRGVDLNRGRWRARFNVRDKGARHLGLFDTEEEAARAYDEVARLHQGFMLNFPSTEEYQNGR